MTQIITRYFESSDKARETQSEMVNILRFSPRIIDLLDSTDDLVDALTSQHVEKATAEAYKKRLALGGAVMLVRAGFKPLRVAQITREFTAEKGAMDLAPLVEEVRVKDPIKQPSSILENHPHMLMSQRDPNSSNYHMANWPIPLISRRKPSTVSLIPPHARMANFPIPLTDRRKPYTGSIIPRHGRMANFPIPLISHRKPFTGSIFARHARMANFPIPLISRRKPFDRTMIPRHGRMASVPIPLLIHEKMGSHALMPGAPRMANFPIPLLSDRKPFTGSIVPKHGRMANFPIPLISKRKPFTGSAIPRHGRMANFILPLIIRREQSDEHTGKQGFSFSKWIGMPTVIRR